MNKNIKALLCFTALVSAVNLNMALAESIIVPSTGIGSSQNILTSMEVYGSIENSGSLSVSDGVVLSEITNTLNNTGAEFNNFGIVNAGNLTNNGVINGYSGTLNISGGNNSGNIIQKDITLNGNFINSNIINLEGKLTNNSALTLNGSSNIVVNEITNASKASITGDGKIEFTMGANNGTIIANGDVTINPNGKFTNKGNFTVKGNFTNSSTISGTGNLTVASGINSANITQTNINIEAGELNNSKTITSNGIFTNDGVLTGEGKIVVKNGQNDGSILQDLSISKNGSFVNNNEIGNLDNNVKITNRGEFINNNSVYASILDNFLSDSVFENNNLTVAYQLSNYGEITGKGKLEITGQALNSGSIQQNELIIDKDAMLLNGKSDSNGYINVTKLTNNGYMSSNLNCSIIADEIINNDEFENFGIIGSSDDKVIITNNKSFINKGSIVASEINNSSTGIFTNNYDFATDKLNNEGTINNNAGLEVKNLVNESIIKGNGTLNVHSGINEGRIEQDSLHVLADFNNIAENSNGLFKLSGSTKDEVFENNGTVVANTILNDGKFVNNGSITTNSNEGATITNRGYFENNESLIAKHITNESGFVNNDDVSLETITIDEKGSLTGNGRLILTSGNSINSGTLEQNSLVLTKTSKLESSGTISVNKLENDGNINGRGTINLGDGVNESISVNKGVITHEKLNNNANSILQNSNSLVLNSLDNEGVITGLTNDSGNVTYGSLTLGNGEDTLTSTNNGQILVDNFVNNSNSTLTGDKGELTIYNAAVNDGVIAQNIVNVTSATFNNNGQMDVKELNNELNSSIIVSGILNVENLNNSKDAYLENNGTVLITGEMNNTGIINNKNKFTTGSNKLVNKGTFINSGSNATMDAEVIENHSVFGVNDGAKVSIIDIDNSDGLIQITNGADLTITNLSKPLDGIIEVINGENNLFIGSSNTVVGTIKLGNGAYNSTLNFTEGTVTEDAIVNITKHGRLNISGANLTLNQNDTIQGDLRVLDNGIVNFEGFNLVTGNSSTQAGGGEPFFEQTGGTLNLKNGSVLAMGNSSLISGGDVNIDDNSKYISRSGGFHLSNLTSSGLIGAMNVQREDYFVENLIIGNSQTGKNSTDLTIDVHGRSNASHQHGTDRFIVSGDIKAADGISDAVINISDWGLAGDIFGWDAPIDRDITLENIFSGNINENVSLTSTRKEVFTPIGWYQLNNHGGTTGNYTLNLTRFNPQVYRGQVTTLAQWMNQLAIDDMLFNHSMVLPSFKDEDGGVGYSGMMANRYASTDPLFAPYQYSRKDGGLWYKMYGTFETMQMSQGLSNVGNNAYGSIIGADFGLKELKNGWKFMPTAYISYNGAHQYYSGLGAYQNGGQAGFLGTFYKNNFILGGLIYGGVYDNSMDIAGHVDSTFNYFAGAATKAAYNWRFHKDWVLQPNLFLSYNYFGQQNWHSAFGQMGMMSGMLNGVNLAPGLNLIWEKETFSIYATLEYMYNLNGAVGGRAGNVNLPHLCMDRGYIQYGLGFTKRFSDRFSGYLQAVLRNVGRTGVGFQFGFSYALGK